MSFEPDQPSTYPGVEKNRRLLATIIRKLPLGLSDVVFNMLARSPIFSLEGYRAGVQQPFFQEEGLAESAFTESEQLGLQPMVEVMSEPSIAFQLLRPDVIAPVLIPNPKELQKIHPPFAGILKETPAVDESIEVTQEFGGREIGFVESTLRTLDSHLTSWFAKDKMLNYVYSLSKYYSDLTLEELKNLALTRLFESHEISNEAAQDRIDNLFESRIPELAKRLDTTETELFKLHPQNIFSLLDCLAIDEVINLTLKTDKGFAVIEDAAELFEQMLLASEEPDDLNVVRNLIRVQKYLAIKARITPLLEYIAGLDEPKGKVEIQERVSHIWDCKMTLLGQMRVVLAPKDRRVKDQ